MSHFILRAALVLGLAFGLTAAAHAGDYRDQSYNPPPADGGSGDSDDEGTPPSTHPLTKLAVDYECIFENGQIYFSFLGPGQIKKGTIIKVKMPDGSYENFLLSVNIGYPGVFGIPGYALAPNPAWDCENAVTFYLGV